MAELKPCPFCGNANITGPCANEYDHMTTFWIECENCEIVIDAFTKSDVIDKWNARNDESARQEEREAIIEQFGNAEHISGEYLAAEIRKRGNK